MVGESNLSLILTCCGVKLVKMSLVIAYILLVRYLFNQFYLVSDIKEYQFL